MLGLKIFRVVKTGLDRHNGATLRKGLRRSIAQGGDDPIGAAARPDLIEVAFR